MNIKKLLALLLVLTMVLCALPVVFAAQEEDAGNDPSDIEVPVESLPEDSDDDILYGDANGDSSVNLRDARMILQYSVGQDVEIDEVASDANGDGGVNLRDARMVLQFSVGQDVQLGPVA